MANPIIEKRHVTMTNAVATATGVEVHTADDYVPVDVLDAYIVDAKLRWQLVNVESDEHDAGPGGDAGSTADLSALNTKDAI